MYDTKRSRQSFSLVSVGKKLGKYQPIPNQNIDLGYNSNIVSECLYICNQNFDRRVHFNCVAVSDEDWMLWNFYEKECDYTDISNQVPKYHDVHHVRVRSFLEQQFLKCDCLLYER
jgi:hypothetical protein